MALRSRRTFFRSFPSIPNNPTPFQRASLLDVLQAILAKRRRPALRRGTDARLHVSVGRVVKLRV